MIGELVLEPVSLRKTVWMFGHDEHKDDTAQVKCCMTVEMDMKSFGLTKEDEQSTRINEK